MSMTKKSLPASSWVARWSLWTTACESILAAFQTDVEDNQFFEFFAGPFGLMRVVTTIDDLEIQGFEMDFQCCAD